MPRPNSAIPYHDLTEASGIPVSDEAASMMVTRYGLAAQLAKGRRTLEIACASGPGLAWLKQGAPFVAGADINLPMLRRARAHYPPDFPLVQASADCLPFPDGFFGCVLFMEASYYLPDVAAVLDEVRRVLDEDGVLLIVNANPERPDFIRSPFSHHYHSGDEFRQLLEARGFSVEIRAAFPITPSSGGARDRLVSGAISVARRLLDGLRLVPRTLRGRARLKRLLGRRLRAMPPQIDPSFGARAPLTEPMTGPIRDHMVIYVTARRVAPHAR